MIDPVLVDRYSAALRAEARAVRALLEVMKKQPVPDDEFDELKEKYAAAVEERKEALLQLWGEKA